MGESSYYFLSNIIPFCSPTLIHPVSYTISLYTNIKITFPKILSLIQDVTYQTKKRIKRSKGNHSQYNSLCRIGLHLSNNIFRLESVVKGKTTWRVFHGAYRCSILKTIIPVVLSDFIHFQIDHRVLPYDNHCFSQERNLLLHILEDLRTMCAVKYCQTLNSLS